MIGYFMAQLALLATGAGLELDAGQFVQIVRERSGAFTSVVFVYEGAMRWVGPNNLGQTPEKFNQEFQGTFLYRADGAGVVDVYVKKSDPTASVVRTKMSVLNDKTQSVRGVLDAKTPLVPGREIRFGQGSVVSLSDTTAPLDFFWTWAWKERGDLDRRNYTFQGWEEVEGRGCLRFQVDSNVDGIRRDLDYRRFWVDVERGAHVVRMEKYSGGKLHTKIDISLFQFREETGQQTWLPSHGHTKWYVWNDVIHDRPVTERIIDVVDGSARVNMDLPDSLFTVRRDTALPASGEMEKLKGTAESGRLRKQFESQPAREQFRTDAASVRRRIDENLAEADRQSKELEASSLSRASWSWTTIIQSALVILGVAVLVGVIYREWTER